MRDELRKPHDRINATTMYVTHDQMEGISTADRIAVMQGWTRLQAKIGVTILYVTHDQVEA